MLASPHSQCCVMFINLAGKKMNILVILIYICLIMSDSQRLVVNL